MATDGDGAPRLRAWMSNPPLVDRILWREGIRPQTLISEDPGLMARTFGTLFVAGGVVGFLILVVGRETDRNDPAIAILASVAIVLGCTCFIAYARLPRAYFVGLTMVGSLLIAGAVANASSGAEGIYALFYVWVVFLSSFFFPFRIAAAMTLFAAVSYGVVLYARDAAYAPNLLISAIATLGTTAAMMGLLRARAEQIAANLTSEAQTDPVTAIANRRGFDIRFEAERNRARRNGRPLSLVICDLDRFKVVNDELGHEEGDRALRMVAGAIAGSVRSMDTVARMGGEEFSVLLPDAPRAEAFGVAERIRQAVLDAFIDYEVPLTASCGVATAPGESLNSGIHLLRAADVALYEAKRAGRNRTAAAAEAATGG